MAGWKERSSWLLLHPLHTKKDFPWTGMHEIAWQLETTDCKENGDFTEMETNAPSIMMSTDLICSKIDTIPLLSLKAVALLLPLYISVLIS